MMLVTMRNGKPTKAAVRRMVAARNAAQTDAERAQVEAQISEAFQQARLKAGLPASTEQEPRVNCEPGPAPDLTAPVGCHEEWLRSVTAMMVALEPTAVDVGVDSESSWPSRVLSVRGWKLTLLVDPASGQVHHDIDDSAYPERAPVAVRGWDPGVAAGWLVGNVIDGLPFR